MSKIYKENLSEEDFNKLKQLQSEYTKIKNRQDSYKKKIKGLLDEDLVNQRQIQIDNLHKQIQELKNKVQSIQTERVFKFIYQKTTNRYYRLKQHFNNQEAMSKEEIQFMIDFNKRKENHKNIKILQNFMDTYFD